LKPLVYISPALLALSGIVLIIASPGFGFYGNSVRLGFLLLGVLFELSCLITLFLKSDIRKIARILFSVILFIGIETLACINQQEVFDPQFLAFRYLCYVLFLIGLIVPLESLKMTEDYKSIVLGIISLFLLVSGVLCTLRANSGLTDTIGRVSLEEGSAVSLSFLSFGCAIVNFNILFILKSNIIRIINLFSLYIWTKNGIFSGTRGGIIAIVILAIYFLIFIHKGKGFHKFIVMIALLGAIVTFMYLPITLPDRLEFIHERIQLLFHPEDDKSLYGDVGREANISQALSLDGFYFFGGKCYSPEFYPHNMIIEILTRFGFWIGLVMTLLILFLLANFKACYIYSDNIIKILLSLGLYSFIYGQMSLCLEFNRPFWLTLGILINFILTNNKGTTQVHYPISK
jgi:hypothetical protein